MGNEARRSYQRYWRAFLFEAAALQLHLPALPDGMQPFRPPLTIDAERCLLASYWDALAMVVAERRRKQLADGGGDETQSAAAMGHLRKAVQFRLGCALDRDVVALDESKMVRGVFDAIENRRLKAAAQRQAVLPAGDRRGVAAQELRNAEAVPIAALAAALNAEFERESALIMNINIGAGLLLSYLLALRVGELLDLRWSDLATIELDGGEPGFCAVRVRAFKQPRAAPSGTSEHAAPTDELVALPDFDSDGESIGVVDVRYWLRKLRALRGECQMSDYVLVAPPTRANEAQGDRQVARNTYLKWHRDALLAAGASSAQAGTHSVRRLSTVLVRRLKAVSESVRDVGRWPRNTTAYL